MATINAMAAVVLRGPANTAPELIVGPFATMEEAEKWSQENPRQGGYCVSQELESPDHVDLDAPD